MIVYTKDQLDKLKTYIAARKNDFKDDAEMSLLFYYLENLTETSLAYYALPFPSQYAKIDKIFDEIESTLAGV